ncbi:hypothetical protein F9L16_09210 [Agarivorans sp. B2Z047]|uniref:hypothetical protein n=1 Tax=Agarivorans sp. B2Z047 TaxID=2652721 RepID=UPI00128C699C|nr:hypothetical protein [Agarivorans sp. B2Z047]
MQQFIRYLGKAVSVNLSGLNNHSLTLNKWLINAARRVQISEQDFNSKDQQALDKHDKSTTSTT